MHYIVLSRFVADRVARLFCIPVHSFFGDFGDLAPSFYPAALGAHSPHFACVAGLPSSRGDPRRALGRPPWAFAVSTSSGDATKLRISSTERGLLSGPIYFAPIVCAGESIPWGWRSSLRSWASQGASFSECLRVRRCAVCARSFAGAFTPPRFTRMLSPLVIGVGVGGRVVLWGGPILPRPTIAFREAPAAFLLARPLRTRPQRPG